MRRGKETPSKIKERNEKPYITIFNYPPKKLNNTNNNKKKNFISPL